MTENILDNKANRLILEKSPYLLQHAYNPIDWYPWGPEAFEKARTEDKPIFMSVGYLACHWCHVMERESFEDEEVAKILNRDFVAIKVDREERPDIDHIYMKVCQGLTGQGGWPLTIIMTPGQEAFYAATYLPKETRGGMSGLIQVLSQISRLWQKDRQRVLQSSQKITTWLQENDEATDQEALKPEVVDQAFNSYSHLFDDEYGGFGEAPKFPSPHNLLFLLRYHFYDRDPRALQMVEKTLDSMYRGGIYDHIGFGFSRYSTDRIWLVPHFEKMLYDNALLAMVYLEAFQITGKGVYAEVARDIFTYVLRDMTSPEGGFYSAEDADSEGEEGKFYTWTLDELKEVLGAEADSFAQGYDISRDGNFEGKSIPNLIYAQTGIDYRNQMDKQRRALFDQREKRIHPLKDDKILSSWNGLMIAALAMGARILNDSVYLEAASRAADFVLGKLRREDGRLLARYREGESQYLGYASDYACMIWGLIELYEAGFESRYLQEAIGLNRDLLKYFWDQDKGGLFFYGEDGEKLLARPKESYDGAIPSDNAIASYNFLRLAKLTGDYELEQRAEETFQLFGKDIGQHPTAYSFWLIGSLFYLNTSRELVIVSGQNDQGILQMLNDLRTFYFPDTVMVYKGKQSVQEPIADLVGDMDSLNGKTTFYLCQGYSCQSPVTSIEELVENMKH